MDTPAAEAVLAVEGLSVSITAGGANPRALIEDCSFSIAAGQVVALVGASGSGKTTLLRAVLGLPPSGASVAGSVKLHAAGGEQKPGKMARGWRDNRRQALGWVPQEPSTALDPRRNAWSHLEERLPAGPQHGRTARAQALWQELELPQRARRDYPHQWSGGMQQRLLLAMAMAPDPRLLLADEPTAALDAVRRAHWASLLQRACRHHAMALLLATHDWALAARLADWVLVMERGRIVQRGLAQDVLPRLRNSIGDAKAASPSAERGGGANA